MRLQVLYIEISIDGAEKIMPAANIETEIVLPNLLCMCMNKCICQCVCMCVSQPGCGNENFGRQMLPVVGFQDLAVVSGEASGWFGFPKCAGTCFLWYISIKL
jgi:hypothetical protein